MAAGDIKLGGEAVRVQGARELRAALRRLGDRELLRELAKVNNRIASLVVSRARARASTPMERSAAGRLKSSKGAAAARVTLGGMPYDLGAEFGAHRNVTRSRSTGSYLGLNQFREWRGNGSNAGYFLFPAIRASREDLIEQYLREIEGLYMRNAA